jgi:hypothetical protein
MSPRLLRIDAMVFRADSVRFEPCPAFRVATDPQLCECGWLADEHAGGPDRAAPERAAPVRRFPRHRSVRVPERRAS